MGYTILFVTLGVSLLGVPLLTFISVKYSYKTSNELSDYLLKLSLDSAEIVLEDYGDSLENSLHELHQTVSSTYVYNNINLSGVVNLKNKNAICNYAVDKIISNFREDDFSRNNLEKEFFKDSLKNKVYEYFPLVEIFYDISRIYPEISIFNFAKNNADHISLVKMVDGSYSVRYVFQVPNTDLLAISWNHFNEKFYQGKSSSLKVNLDLYNNLEKVNFLKNKKFNKSKSQEIYKSNNSSRYVVDFAWFKGAKISFKKGQKKHASHFEPYFIPPYIQSFTKEPSLGASQAIINKNGKIFAVVSVEESLAYLSSTYFSNLQIGKHGRIFVVTPEANIIAYTPDLFNIKSKLARRKKIQEEVTNLSKKIINSNNYVLRSVFDPSVPVYKKAYQSIKEKEQEQLLKTSLSSNSDSFKNKSIKFDFNYNDETYIGIWKHVSDKLYFDIFVGVLFPKKDFIYSVDQNIYLSILIASFSFLISIAASFTLSNSVSIPIKRMIEHMHNIKNLKLNTSLKPPSELIEFSEMHTMHKAFVSMETGLKSFEKYVPSNLVRGFINSEKEAVLGGETKTLTVYFSDVSGFTTISEKLSPQKLVKELGEYLYEMSLIIDQNKGTLDKYIGDAIMAFWGAPVNVKNHAYFACKTALECQHRLTRLQYTRWNNPNDPIFRARVGINTGELVVGNMGSPQRINYTVIGDSVNLASRLEGLNKFYGTSVICSGETKDLITEDIITRKLDFVAVKGKKDPVAIFEVVGFDGDVSDRELRFIKQYEEALELYLIRQFDSALKAFQSTLKIKLDPAIIRFIKYCEEYIVNPPPIDWNGVYTFLNK